MHNYKGWCCWNCSSTRLRTFMGGGTGCMVLGGNIIDSVISSTMVLLGSVHKSVEHTLTSVCHSLFFGDK
ncbi:hypothetical protein BC832DRAFT_471422 [Gaertneriomyces semiglobifer]|nr:hypothetical protein BC832DRAFT_471422 [Gaertneriomyces semiglobifer]